MRVREQFSLRSYPITLIMFTTLEGISHATFLMAGLPTFALSILVAPTAHAETTPNELVNLARTGYRQEQGIPSHAGLEHAVRLGQLNAQALVQAGIAADRLSPETLNDASYLSSVEMQLRNLLSD